jgi:PGF-pre-PGF domain-containing protein
METAYTDAAGRAGPDATELYAGNLGGRTLAPGLYKWSTGVLIPASTALTLDAKGNGDAVWIFQVSGDLTMSSASQVVLINGAKAENIYWQIGGGTGVTLEAGAHAEGTILAAKAITMKSGASLHGRALAQTAVTLIANTITAPTPAPAQTAVPTTVQTVATTPAQTAATTTAQTAAPTTTTAPTGAASTTKTVNVGGNSGVYQAKVTGTGNTGLTVTGTTASGPGQGIPQPSGTVYQYLDLAPAHYTTIDQAVISFTVPVSWLDDHNIAPQNVVLQHLDGTMWDSLPTTLVQTVGGQVYFTAVSSGFGRFAITGQYTSAATTVQTIVSTVAQTAQPTSQPTSLPTTKSPVPVWVPVTAVIGALLIMAVLSGRSGKNS